MDLETTWRAGTLPARGVPSLFEESQFLRHLIRGMRCGVVTIDRGGRLLMLNEPALQILELDDAPPPGSHVEDALQEHPQLARVLRDSFTMSNLPNRAEIDIRCKSEHGKTIGLTLSLVAEEDGEPYAAAAFFKDLTPVEQREEQERLRDRLAALGQMAASMAHEIRNPLASIGVTCSLLKRRLGTNEATRGMLDKIITEVRRLNGTITSSLEFVRPLSLTLAPGSLEDVVETALSVAWKRRGGPGVQVVKRIAEQIPPVPMDAAQLRQVFENLFLNALEAMDQAGTLTIEMDLVEAPAAASVPYVPQDGDSTESSSGPDCYVEVRVSDTGSGISEEHRNRLFYPFFTTKKDGSGVGLALAKKVVDSHRGLIDVDSRPGEGAVFTVRVPLGGAATEA